MTAENTAETEVSSQSDQKTGSKRQRSSIAFPYMDLDEAVALAKAIHDKVGTGTCSAQQLAPWMKQSHTSSAFRSRLSASRHFGLVNTESDDALHLTELGRLVVDPQREREGRAKAFLAVPLFRALHDKFKGGVLPPTAALEKELVALGVADTLKERARSVLERSAEEANFFEAGRDRLVMPGFVPAGQNSGGGERLGGGGGDGSGGTGRGRDHPLVKGLFDALPATEEWPMAERLRWLRAAEVNLSFAYKPSPDDKGEIEIKLKTEPK